jgi:site-specific DNA-methyltransferase (adenine-specific)
MRPELRLGDCLDVMGSIPDGSIDLILADLPYGTTACKWDVVIPFEPLWAHYRRLLKPRGAVVLTASQPFTSMLVMSNREWFKYCDVWDKVNRYTGALNANRMPLRRHEDVAVFAPRATTFNPQFREGRPYQVVRTNGHGSHTAYGKGGPRRIGVNAGLHHPCSILPFKGDMKTEMGFHPTQKPVALMEYLIRTYSNEGDTVLDNCMGSGTTGVACLNTDRDFIGIESDPAYFAIAEQRIAAEIVRHPLLPVVASFGQ